MGSNSSKINSQPKELQVTFLRFADLPGELQNKIWEDALPPQRVVKLTFVPDRGWEMCDVSGFNQSIESLKYACRASNYFCRNYKLYRQVAYKSTPSKRGAKSRQKQDLWVNCKLDTIFLDYDIPMQAIYEARRRAPASPPHAIAGLGPSLWKVPHYPGLRESGILNDIVNIAFGLRLWLCWQIHPETAVICSQQFQRFSHTHYSQRITRPPMILNKCKIIDTKRPALLLNAEGKNPFTIIFHDGRTMGHLDMKAIYEEYPHIRYFTNYFVSKAYPALNLTFMCENASGGFTNIEDGTAWPENTE